MPGSFKVGQASRALVYSFIYYGNGLNIQTSSISETYVFIKSENEFAVSVLNKYLLNFNLLKTTLTVSEEGLSVPLIVFFVEHLYSFVSPYPALVTVSVQTFLLVPPSQEVKAMFFCPFCRVG